MNSTVEQAREAYDHQKRTHKPHLTQVFRLLSSVHSGGTGPAGSCNSVVHPVPKCQLEEMCPLLLANGQSPSKGHTAPESTEMLYQTCPVRQGILECE